MKNPTGLAVMPVLPDKISTRSGISEYHVLGYNSSIADLTHYCCVACHSTLNAACLIRPRVSVCMIDESISARSAIENTGREHD